MQSLRSAGADVTVKTFLGGLLPGARQRRVQVREYAEQWEASNTLARSGSGPLWVAIGDSASQAIGAATREDGYVIQVLRHLQRSDPSWRVVNLSRTGAIVADVLDEQVPAMQMLEPALVTCAAGANDLLRTPQAVLEEGLRSLAAHLPPGSLMATLPQGLRVARSQAANEVIVVAAAERGLRVVDLWAHTGPPWRGKFSADAFHPNEIGYRDWTRAFLETLDGPPRVRS